MDIATDPCGAKGYGISGRNFRLEVTIVYLFAVYPR